MYISLTLYLKWLKWLSFSYSIEPFNDQISIMGIILASIAWPSKRVIAQLGRQITLYRFFCFINLMEEILSKNSQTLPRLNGPVNSPWSTTTSKSSTTVLSRQTTPPRKQLSYPEGVHNASPTAVILCNGGIDFLSRHDEC